MLLLLLLLLQGLHRWKMLSLVLLGLLHLLQMGGWLQLRQHGLLALLLRLRGLWYQLVWRVHRGKLLSRRLLLLLVLGEMGLMKTVLLLLGGLLRLLLVDRVDQALIV